MTPLEKERFDAVFMAVGANVGRSATIPAGDAARVLDAVSVLRSTEGDGKPLLGRRVAIYGGGNTAMDVARTAKRLGAEEAVVVYRRTRERMPAHDFEVEEAEEEGVLMKWLSTVTRADSGMLVLERMELDETGFPSRPASSRSWRPTRSSSRSGRRPISPSSRMCRESRLRTVSSRSART